MSPISKKVARFTSAVLVSSLVACGGTGSNNDQGTSVTATQYCADVQCATGQTGAIVPLRTNVNALSGSTQNGTVFPLDGQTVITFMQLTNQLTSQFFRVDRIDCAYTIPGADSALFVPNDSFAVGGTIAQGIPVVAGAAGGAAGGAGAAVVSSAAFGFSIVTPDFFAFLNVNENLLPQLPFRAVATCAAVGVSQGGDTLTTNSLNFSLQFGEVSAVTTGGTTEVPGTNGGFQGGVGSGGTLNTFGSNATTPTTPTTTTTTVTNTGTTTAGTTSTDGTTMVGSGEQTTNTSGS